MKEDYYRVEVDYWGRSDDGDDWITRFFWASFDTLCMAMDYAKKSPFKEKDLIEIRVIHVTDRHSKWKILYERDYTKMAVSTLDILEEVLNEAKSRT